MSSEAAPSNSQRNSSLFWLLATATMAVAFAVRWHIYKVWDYIGSADQGAYLSIARGIAAWKPITATVFTPGFPAIAAVFIRLGFPLDRCGQMATMLCGMAAIVLIGVIAARQYGRRAALLAMAIAAVHPDLVRRSTNGMSEMPYATVLLLALLLLGAVVRSPARRGSTWLLVGTGMALGWLYLTRPEGIGVGGALALSLAVGARLRWRESITRVAIVIGTMLVVALPYIVRLHTVTGHWTVAGKTAMTFGVDERPETTDVAPPQGEQDAAYANPMAVFKRTPKNIIKYVRSAPAEYDSPALFALAALGLLGLPWTLQRRREEAPPLFTVVATVLIASAFYYNSRFILALLPLFIIWAGAGAVFVSRWWVASFACGRRTAALASVMALGFAVVPNMSDLGRLARRSEVPLEERPAAEWLKTHVPANARALNGKTMVPFYAGLGFDVAPHAAPDVVHAAAIRAGDEYLVVGERQDAKWWPNLMPFTNDQSPPPGFELVYQSREKPRVLIYRVLPSPTP